MKITKKDIIHLANLSRLNFTEEEMEKFNDEFQQIIDYFKVIDSVDTSDIEITNTKLNSKNELREDIPTVNLTQDQVVSGSKDKKDGMVRVPKIIG